MRPTKLPLKRFLHIRLSEDLANALEEIAVARESTLSVVAREILKKHVGRCREEFAHHQKAEGAN